MVLYLIVTSFLLLSVDISSQAETCRHDQVSVRLVNGTSERNGRVELCWNYQWKAVCDSGWGQAEANTVCRELGYLNSNDHAIAVTGSHFGDAQEIHDLNQWNCRPTDTILAYCSKSITRHLCGPSETAGVYCPDGSNCRDGEVKLTGGLNQSRGTVEICLSGIWGTICDDGWDISDAGVACRQLGYLTSNVLANTEKARVTHKPQHLSHVRCTGQESRLTDCVHQSIGMRTCESTSSRTAAVVCSDPVQATLPYEGKDSPTSAKSTTTALTMSNNSSSESSSARNQIKIIAACIGCGTVLLAVVILLVSMAVACARKRRQQLLNLTRDKPSMHHYSSEHIYDEVTTLAKPKGKEPSSTVAMVEQDSAAGYETIATDIPTKSNEAYGYLNRQQL